MTEEIKIKLKELVDIAGITASDVADFIIELEKENTELKKDLKLAIDANQKWLRRDTELEEEKAELKKDLQTAEAAIKKLVQRETELEVQIEKMKCCGNCGNYDGNFCKEKSAGSTWHSVCEMWKVHE